MDTYSKVAHCKLYQTKTPITGADLPNDKVLPFYESQDLTDTIKIGNCQVMYGSVQFSQS